MDIVIVGAGGHGRVVLDIVRQAGEHLVAGFLDSNPALHGRRVDGKPVLGDMSLLPALRERGVTGAVVAIGTNGIRREFAEDCERAGFELINAIHPSANLASNVTLGRNLVIAAGALVCAHSQIADSVILNTGCIVDHETRIGTAVHICPGARLAGRVIIDAGAFVGIGATIVQTVRIGADAIVGAGAVVACDVEPLTTVVGIPAKPIKAYASPDEFTEWLLPEYIRQRRPSGHANAKQSIAQS